MKATEAAKTRMRERNARIKADPDLLAQRQIKNARSQRSRDPAKKKAEKDRYRSANSAIIRAAKDAPCADCGVRYPFYVMQFDHRDPAEKLFNIGIIGPTASRDRLIAEIAKCDVVCSNCHAERSYQQMKGAINA